MTEAQRLNVLYGDVLSIYGIPNNHPLLKAYGSKLFDKRTSLYKIATTIRREELKKEYKIK